MVAAYEKGINEEDEEVANDDQHEVEDDSKAVTEHRDELKLDADIYSFTFY